ncbi:MAG: hypothetical protein LBV71_19215 [Prevotella sp.]|jgi:hypothetical protein|nr:hypothetical protein [Prevotella sp.]
MKKRTGNNKGLLSIRITCNNKMSVVFQPVSGTVWMDRNELCELFGCYMQDIDLCIKELFEKNMLKVEETCKYHIIAGSRRVSYDITEVNLVVIITMAFRLDTPESRTLRMWFVEQIAKIKSLDAMLVDVSQNAWWN